MSILKKWLLSIQNSILAWILFASPTSKVGPSHLVLLHPWGETPSFPIVWRVLKKNGRQRAKSRCSRNVDRAWPVQDKDKRRVRQDHKSCPPVGRESITNVELFPNVKTQPESVSNPDLGGRSQLRIWWPLTAGNFIVNHLFKEVSLWPSTERIPFRQVTRDWWTHFKVLCNHLNTKPKAGECTQLVECLPSTREALSTIPCSAKIQLQ